MSFVRSLFRVALLPTAGLAAWMSHSEASHAQSYDEIEGRVRQQMEQERASAIGDCSEAMVSWLGLRFTDTERRQGRAHDACAAAQLFSLRNGVPFLDALPRVAQAMGGTRSQPCPPAAVQNNAYRFYSGCYIPAPPDVPRPPTAWEVARQKEVRELGPAALHHIQRCVPRSSVPFAFVVRENGRIDNFSEAGDFGRIGPDPEQALELKRIELKLRSDARCAVFPPILRNRYISVKPDAGRLRIDQVRDEAAPGPVETLRVTPNGDAR